jgi:hypothetical protein
MKISILLFLLLSVHVFAQKNLNINLSSGQTEKHNLNINNKAGSALFSTMGGIDPLAFAVISSELTDIPNFFTAAADDFTITNCAWEINTISANGNYSGGAGPAGSVNIYIMDDSAGLPNTTNLSGGAKYAAENLSYTDIGSGDFEISLPSGLILQEGKYWLTVQANISFVSNGQWNWNESSLTPNSGTTNGDESAWFQSTAGVTSPITGNFECVNSWGARVTTCGMTRDPDASPPADRDMAFSISGNILAPGVTLSESILTTSEDGMTESYDVSLNAPPASGATVTVTPQSNDATEGSVSGALSFSSADWNIPQQVTITPGASGDGNDGDVQYQITHSVATTNPTGCYSALANGGSINVTNQDIDGVPVELQSFEIE